MCPIFSKKETNQYSLKAAERAIIKLRSIEEQYTEEDNPEYLLAVQKSEEILRPFLLAITLDSKNNKIVPVSVSCIQKLISRQAVSVVMCF